MTPFFIKCRVTDRQPVKLSAFENGSSVYILMSYSSGYVQIMSYKDFSSALTTSRAINPDSPILEDIFKELDNAIHNPLNH